MSIAIRRTVVILTAVMAAALLALTTATSALAGKAFMVGGLATPVLHDVVMAPLLGYRFAQDERVSVWWPAQARPYTGGVQLTLGESIAVGQNNLIGMVDSAISNGKPVTVVGLSAGALVVSEFLRDLANSTDAPDKSQLSFVVISDSSRQSLINGATHNSTLGYAYRPAPITKYDIKVVTGEYDGVADLPDRWWNILAVANAYVGAIFVHIPAMYADISDLPFTTTTNHLGGVTENYVVPTERLPLVQLFSFLAPMEQQLKAIVDSGYSRNDYRAVATLTTADKPIEMNAASSDPSAKVAPAESTVSVDYQDETSQRLADVSGTPADAVDATPAEAAAGLAETTPADALTEPVPAASVETESLSMDAGNDSQPLSVTVEPDDSLLPSLNEKISVDKAEAAEEQTGGLVEGPDATVSTVTTRGTAITTSSVKASTPVKISAAAAGDSTS